MPYFVIVDGKAFDWRFRQCKTHKFMYNFYIVDNKNKEILLGQLSRMTLRTTVLWSAISGDEKPKGFRMVNGFARRHDAGQRRI